MYTPSPPTPKNLIDRKTPTTSALSGIPAKFIITLLWLSGMYLLRRVPMLGKYIPTTASKEKKLAIARMSPRNVPELSIWLAIAPPPIASAATAIAFAVLFSTAAGTGTFFVCCSSLVNRLLPNKQQAIKQLNTRPYGVATPTFPLLRRAK